MKKCIFLMLICIGFMSCEKDDASTVATSSQTFSSYASKRSLSDSIQISKELSIAVGRTLTVTVSRNNAIAAIQKLDTLSDAATLAALMEVDTKITTFEKNRLTALSNTLHGLYSGGTNNFKGQLLHELKQNPTDYALLLSGINLHASDIDTQLTNLVANQGLALGMPYAENFDYGTISSFTMAYDNLSANDQQSGQLFASINQTGNCICPPPSSTPIATIDDDYLNGNPSFTIIPSAGDDYYGGVSQSGVMQATYPPIYASGLPTPILSTYTTLVNNYNISDFGDPDEYIMTTSIPKMRVKGTGWKRTFDTQLRLLIIRAGTKFTINSDGTYSSSESAYYFRIDVSAHSLRKSRWIDVNWQFDSNWQPQEGSQQIICITLRSNADNVSTTADVKIKLDSEGNYTPDASVSTSITKGATKAILRGNRELDAHQVFATIIGGAEPPANATYNYAGANLSVRSIDRFEYFFEHDYKDLTN